MKKRIILSTLFLIIISAGYAQQQGRGRQDPTALAQREKQMVLDSISDLSEDQIQLIEFVYAQYGESLQAAREEVMSSGNREGMREKMQAIRKEKTESLKDIFNTDQMNTYQAMMERVRETMQQRRQERRKKRESSGREGNE